MEHSYTDFQYATNNSGDKNNKSQIELKKSDNKNIISDAPTELLIIGGGPAGLTTLQQAKDAGISAILLEKSADLGGVWNPESGATWPTMRTNLSKHTCHFSTYNWPEISETFPEAPKMYDYLKNYSANFQLQPYIHYNCEVTQVTRQISGEKWQIIYIENGQMKEQLSQAVVVASGIFAKPYTPNIPNLDLVASYTHSQYYKNNEDFCDKTVLVLGGSLSAVEVTSHIAQDAIVHHIFKEPFWIIPRYLPTTSANPTVNITESKFLPNDLLFYKRTFINTSNNKVAQPSFADKCCMKNEYMENLCLKQQKIPNLTIKKSKFCEPIKIAISDSYLSQVETGRIKPKEGKIIKFQENSAILDNGESIKFDQLVLATGYNCDLSFLDEKTQQILQYKPNNTLLPIIAYQNVAHPALPNMYFIAIYKGPYFATIEYQAKYAIGLLTGKYKLPPASEIQQNMDESLVIRETQPAPQFPFSDYPGLTYKIAKLCSNHENKDKDKHMESPKLPNFTTTDEYNAYVDLKSKFSKTFPQPGAFDDVINIERMLEKIDENNKLLEKETIY